MKNLFLPRSFLAVVLVVSPLILFISACKDDDDDGPTTYYGPTQTVVSGQGQTWVKVNSHQIPTSVGIDLTANTVLGNNNTPWTQTFQLPPEVAAAPYDHVDVSWNPVGHEPAPIYGVPHFDLHFYTITRSFQATIPGVPPPTFDTPVDAKYIPANYIQTPGVEADMGVHWVDTTSAEFKQGKFTKTFIYGSYKGNVTFFEPMVTLEYFQQKLNETFAVKKPQAYQKTGYYPAKYKINYQADKGMYSISLEDLQFYSAQ